jgi:hypothetical protein
MKVTLRQFRERVSKFYIPDTLLDVAEIEVGDYLEITIRKVKSRK